MNLPGRSDRFTDQPERKRSCDLACGKSGVTHFPVCRPQRTAHRQAMTRAMPSGWELSVGIGQLPAQSRQPAGKPAQRQEGLGEAGYAWCGLKTPPCPGSAARLRRKSPEKGVARPGQPWPRAGPVRPGLHRAAPFLAPGSRGGPTLTERILSDGKRAVLKQAGKGKRAILNESRVKRRYG